VPVAPADDVDLAIVDLAEAGPGADDLVPTLLVAASVDPGPLISMLGVERWAFGVFGQDRDHPAIDDRPSPATALHRSRLHNARTPSHRAFLSPTRAAV
jgi:hypothetical protein